MIKNHKTVAAVTLGCKVNLYDTEAVLKTFTDSGYKVVDFDEYADVYVINTCSVTNMADKKSRQMVRRAKAKNSNAIVAAMGCSSQLTPEKYKQIGANVVIGTSARGKILESIQNIQNNGISQNKNIEYVEDIFKEKSFGISSVDNITDRTRAFLKIQEGCNGFCTFCIIPHVRGFSRSRNFDDTIVQAKRFVSAGYKEIVVAGIHVASYGKDLESKNLIDVLKELCKIDGIVRVRLSSVEPNVVNDDFLEFVQQNPKFCDHMHLALQSASPRILKLMNRKYTPNDYELAVKNLRKVLPDINITTDIIAGFPSETEDEHKETYDFIKYVSLSSVHVFPFSPKYGTVAAKMPNQLSNEIKNRRTKEIILLASKLERDFYSRFVGKNMDVLIENMDVSGFAQGKTTNYINVAMMNNKERTIVNEIVNASIVSFGDRGLVAEVL